MSITLAFYSKPEPTHSTRLHPAESRKRPAWSFFTAGGPIGRRKRRILARILLITLISGIETAPASSLIYTPGNPSFGGPAANGSYLLNNANAQNQFEDPNASNADQTPLEEFNQRLQRALLGRVTSVISRSVIGTDGSINPGSFETTDFLIDISDLGGGQMSITTTDKLTGDQTSITIDTGF